MITLDNKATLSIGAGLTGLECFLLSGVLGATMGGISGAVVAGNSHDFMAPIIGPTVGTLFGAATGFFGGAACVLVGATTGSFVVTNSVVAGLVGGMNARFALFG